MIGILGSGYGLYGYLPALCQSTSEKICISHTSKEKIYRRPELVKYIARIYFAESIEEIIFNCTTLVIAYPPKAVYPLIEIIELSSTINKIIVEKPLCTNPDLSLEFINRLRNKNIKIISGFIFFYTDWYSKLSEHQLGDLKIIWKFKRSENLDIAQSWKYKKSCGGGALNMYGIHLLSILTKFNISTIKIVTNNDEHFNAFFNINFKFNIEIDIELTKSISLFEISTIISQETPFGEQTEEFHEDFRVKYITQLLYDFEYEYEKLNLILYNTMNLWSSIEKEGIK